MGRLADADDERAFVPGAPQRLRGVRREQGKGERPSQLPGSRYQGLFDTVPLVMVRCDEVDNHFRIGFRSERIPLPLQGGF